MDIKLDAKKKRERVQHTFDYFCKKVMKNEKFNYDKVLKRKRQYEVPLERINDLNRGNINLSYDYKEERVFSVFGIDVIVMDIILAEALSYLEKNNRDILLLSYFLNLTDEEVAVKLNISRRTLTFWRHKALKELKSIFVCIREDGGVRRERKKG
ncbi:TPA: sigma factor-like helix-turn-helix DNA-binding protein [Listeria monocytogenes]